MTPSINLIAGWGGFLAGVITGALLGLFFHRENWLGGYGSFPRRMLRLGHIACFGMGLLNILFALSVAMLPLAGGDGVLQLASLGLLVALVTMPVCCALTAWRRTFRHLFPIPVAATLAGVAAAMWGWVAP